MDLNNQNKQGQNPQPESSSPVTDTQYTGPLSNYASSSTADYSLESLEVADPNAANARPEPVVDAKTQANVGGAIGIRNRRKAVLVSLIITIFVLLFSSASIWFLASKNADNQQSAAVPVPSQDIDIPGDIQLAPELIDGAPSLVVDGDIVTRSNLKVASGSFLSVLSTSELDQDQAIALPNASGTVCLDSNNCAYAEQDDLQALQNSLNLLNAQLGQVAIPTIPPSSLVNDQDGEVSIQGTNNRVSVTTNNGTITLSSPQDIATGSSPTFAGLVLNGGITVNGTITTNLNCTTFLNGGSLTTNTSGQIICADDETSGGGTSVTTAGGTVGYIPMFNAADQIQNSIISQALGTVTVAGNLNIGANNLVTSTATISAAEINLLDGGIDESEVTGVITDVTAGNGLTGGSASGNAILNVASGNGGIVVGANDITLTLQPNKGLEVDANGLSIMDCSLNQVLKYNGSGEWACDNDADSTASFNVAADSGTPETIGDTDTVTIAGGDNITTSVGATDTVTVNTVQNPSFTTSVTTPLLQSSGALTITPGGALTVGATGQTALLQGSTTTISSNSGGDIILSSDNNIRLDGFDCSAMTNGGKLTTDASGNISCANDNGAAGAVTTSSPGTQNRLALFTGASTVADSWLLQNGSTLELDTNRNLSLSGSGGIIIGGDTITDFVGSGLQVSTGSLQTTLGTSVDLASAEVIGVLPVTNGGTGVNGGSAANGTLLIGNGSGYTLATITAGDGITVNNSAGGIEVVNAFGTSIESAEIADLTIVNNDIANSTINLSTKTTGNYVATVAGSSQVSVSGSGSNNAAVTLGIVADSIGDAQLAFNTGQNLTTTSTPTFAGLIVSDGTVNTGTINIDTLTSPRTYILPDSDGEVCLVEAGNCAGSGSGVTSSGGTTNRLAKFSGAQAVTDSTITDDGTTVTTTADLAVQGGDLTVGTALQDAALVLYGNGFAATINSSSISAAQTYNLPDGSGEFCIRELGNCSGSGGGNAPNDAQYLVLSLNGGLSAERTLSFNGTNFSVTDGGANGSYSVNTTQDIDTAASPEFSGLELTGGLDVNANTIQGTTAVIDFNNFDVASNGNVTAGTYNGQTISSTSNLTGSLDVAGLTTLNGGLTVEAGDTITFNGEAFNDLTGDGLQVTGNALTLLVQASKGLELDSNGLSLVDCTDGQILKYETTGNTWQCGNDAGGTGLGDDVFVNGNALDGANFIDTANSASIAGINISRNTVANPDEVSIVVSDASGTMAGIVTANAQTFGGEKTFNAEIQSAGGIDLGAQTLTGTTAVIDFNNFDVASNGNVTAGTYNGQTISSVASLTGSLDVAGLTTLNGGLTVDAGDTITFNGESFTDISGNGLQVTGNALTLAVQANKGLELDGNGLSLVDCTDGQILKYETTGNTWGCAADAGGTGVGDDVLVDGSNADGANFIDTTSSASVAGVDFSLNAGTTPDQISVTISDASATMAGAVTANAQTFGGDKTFTGALSVQGNVTLGDAGTDTITMAGASASTIQFAHASFASCTALETNASGYLVCGSDDDGTGNGYVDATGTPVAGQVAFFNDSDTLQGSTALTFSGGLLTLANTLNANGGISFDNLTDTIAGIQNQNLVDKTSAETITAVWTFNNGVTVTNGQDLTIGSQAFNDLTGNGLTQDGTALAVYLNTGSGLVVDGSGLSLLRTCGNDQVLKWDGSAWVCDDDSDTSDGVGATDLQTAYVGGNNITATDVEGDIEFDLTQATSFIVDIQDTGDFQIQDGGSAALTVGNNGNTTLTGDLAVNGGDITSTGALNITPGGVLMVGASGQTASLQGSVVSVTSNGAGNDITFSSADQVVVNAGSTIELQDNTNITGNLNTTGTGVFQGASVTVGAAALQGSLVLNDGNTANGGSTITITSADQTGNYTATIPVLSGNDTFCLVNLGNCAGQGQKNYTMVVAANDSPSSIKSTADYIADGTDDQVEINAALTAAAGGSVYLAEGTYIASATILVPNNTTLAGAGKSTIIELADIDVTDNLIENSDTSTGTGVTIRDLRLNGRQDLNTVGLQRGIELSGMGSDSPSRAGAHISGVLAENFNEVGIYMYWSDNNTITNNVAQNNTNGTGFYIHASSHNTITGNVSHGNYDGIAIYQSTDNSFTSNTAYSNAGSGFYINNSNSNSLVGNTVRNNATYGVYLFTSSARNTISGNVIRDNGGSTDNNAVYALSADNNIITDNLISDSSCTTTCYSINISDSASDGNYLADNTLGTGTINDSGTGTVYGGQTGASGEIVIRSGSTGDINIDSGTTGSVNIAAGNNAKAVNVGTGSAAKTISIGNSNASTVATLTGGAYNLNIGNTGVGINATTPTTGSVDLFFGSGTDRMININQAASGTGDALTIQAGQGASGANAGGDLLLQGGAQGTSGGSGSVIVRSNGTNTTTAFIIQQQDTTALFTADTTNRLVKVGIGTPTIASATTGGLYVTNHVEVAGRLLVGSTSNGIDTNTGQARFTGTYRNDISITLRPEFDGATFNPDGTNNVGYLTSGFCSNVGGGLSVNTSLCGSSEVHSYYNWQSSEASAQDYDMYVRYKLPSDFDEFADDSTIKLWGRRDASTDIVAYGVYQANGTQCGSDTTVTTSDDTWQQGTHTGNESSGCTFAAGDVVTFKISVTSEDDTAGAFVGEIDFTYKSKF